MFGNKTRALRAENQRMDNDLRSAGDLFARIADQDERLQGYYADMQESRAQLEKGRQQLVQNSDTAAALIAENVGYMGQMGTALGLFGQQLLAVANAQKEALEGINNQKAVLGALEEGIMQGTAAETPRNEEEEAEEDDTIRQEILETMSGLGKEMGVLALNAAIEAGRMGEEGRQFMTAAEQVRVHAGEYDKAALQIKEIMERDKKRIAELEKQVDRMQCCLSESKTSVSALQERQENARKAVSRISVEALMEQLTGMKETLQNVTDHDQQIAKIGERNQIQLADMEEEAKVYLDLQEEAAGQMRPLIDEAADYSLHFNH